MLANDEDKALATFGTKAPRRVAETTGRYRNPGTLHEAWYEQGAPLPLGYEPSDEATPGAEQGDEKPKRPAAKQ